MRCHDNTLYGFSLVSTYLPFVVLIVRGSLCVLVIHWISGSISMQALTMIIACVVYIDSMLMSEFHFDKACGHLCVCALAVLTQLQQQKVHCSSSQVLFITFIDLLWSAAAGVEVILRTTGAKIHTQYMLKTLMCCCFASMRVCVSCYELGCMFALLRTSLYFVLCALLLLCGPFLPQHERQLHSIIHVCAHVLFVHLYAVIASVAVMLAVHARLLYLHVAEKNHTHKDNKTDKHEQATTASSAQQTDYSDLVKKLQAAKRAQNVA